MKVSKTETIKRPIDGIGNGGDPLDVDFVTSEFRKVLGKL